MPKNMMCKICAITALWAALTVFTSCICYATRITIELNIKCSSNSTLSQLRTGKPKVKYTLVSKRILDSTNIGAAVVVAAAAQDDSTAGVIATCTPYGKDHLVRMNRIGTVLSCEKGQGIAINVFSPNSKDPEQYKFIADLIVDVDDDGTATIEEPVQIQSNIGSTAVSTTSSGAACSSYSRIKLHDRIIKECNFLKIAELLERGADIDSTGRNGRTVLWWAAFRGDVELVRFLIVRGANRNISDELGQTPLDIAREHALRGYREPGENNNHAEVVTILSQTMDGRAIPEIDEITERVRRLDIHTQAPEQQTNSYDWIYSLCTLL